ncbi:MAG: BACON domain-containing protein, partial [Alistipes sp.]|nr:BACON domain-containing protein [Alistipes sp.]
MKRLIYIAFLTLLFSSCQVPPVPQDHLSILSGVSNNQLAFDGKEGSRATFSLSSKLAWEILDTPGVTYSPSKGEATERVTITATIHSSNRSLKIREVGDVIIRLNRTRFTGITAVQRPLITLEQEQVTLSAVQSEYSTFTYTSKEADIEVVAEGDIVCTQPQSIGSDKYSVQVAPTKDNLSIEENTAGNITFKVAGDALFGKLQAIQRPALSFDRSRITVGGNSGEQASVSVNSTFDFTVTATTTAIEVAKGENGMVDITVVEPNTTSQERKLGAITVTLVDNPSCNISIDVWQRTALAERTMMFYYLGMSLKSFYDANLATVEKCVESGSLGDTRVLAFIQSSQNSGSLYEIFYDKGLGKIVRDPIATYDLPQLYSEQMLSEIFCDMTVRAPAKEYGLFIGSHGKGWIPKNSASL